MEFFRIINNPTSEANLQQKITPENVNQFAETMLFLEKKGANFMGATLWGEFLISYDFINGGVRFSLLDCPNALCWTITTGFPPQRDAIILHCTINRTQKAPEFVDEINEFLDEWETGLKNLK